ncbi:MAG: TRAP transporter large permease [Spirochaetes bacterium]|nr:TRAP transporter large permease [Spirochaetota bacterium]
MALLILLAIMFLLVGFGFSIWAAMGISGVVYILIRGSYSLKVVISSLLNGVDNSSLLAIPLFILAGELMNRAGITKKLSDFAEYFVGRLKGGLAYVAIIVNVILAGISGSAIADASAVASVMLPAMKEKGYDPEFSASINAAAAVIGPIIPPSIPMIFLGAISGLSIGKLFLGGFVPGLMMGLFLAVTVFITFRKKDRQATPLRQYTFASLFKLFRESFLAIIAPVIVILGVILGIVTVVEVAVLVNVYILLISLFVYRSIKWKDLFGIIGKAALFSSTMMILFGIVGLYQYIAVSEQLDQQVMSLLVAWHLNKYTFLMIVNVFFLIWGCLMDAIPGMLIFFPVLMPVAIKLGIDPIHFGVIVVINLMIGLITPPVGGLLFLTTKLAKIPFDRLARKITPNTIALILVLLICTYIPPLVTFLPNLFFH